MSTSSSALIQSVCMLILSINCNARADVIQNYPIVSSTLENPVGLFFSDFNQNLQTAARFNVEYNSEMQSAVWYGGYLNTTADPAGPLQFVIRLFEHDPSGHPAAAPLYETSVLATGLVTPYTAVSGGGGSGLRDVFKYEAVLTPVSLPAGDTFWISIVEDTTDLVWFWAPSVDVGGLTNVRRFTDSSSWRDTGGRLPSVTILGDIACIGDIPGVSVGTVDVLDLLELLAAWGAGAGNPADFNGDDLVDVTDLLDLLNGWGPCE